MHCDGVLWIVEGLGWLLAAILRPTAAVNALVTHQLLFLKFPSEREAHGIHGGATSEHAWWRRPGQFQGLTLVAIIIHLSDLLPHGTWLTDSLSCCLLSVGPFLKEMGYFCPRLSINSVDIFSELVYYQRLFFYPILLSSSSSQVSDLHHGLKVLPTFSRLLFILHRPFFSPK